MPNAPAHDAISFRSARPLRGSTLSRRDDAARLEVRTERLGQRRPQQRRTGPRSDPRRRVPGSCGASRRRSRSGGRAPSWLRAARRSARPARRLRRARAARRARPGGGRRRQSARATLTRRRTVGMSRGRFWSESTSDARALLSSRSRTSCGCVGLEQHVERLAVAWAPLRGASRSRASRPCGCPRRSRWIAIARRAASMRPSALGALVHQLLEDRRRLLPRAGARGRTREPLADGQRTTASRGAAPSRTSSALSNRFELVLVEIDGRDARGHAVLRGGGVEHREARRATRPRPRSCRGGC